MSAPVITIYLSLTVKNVKPCLTFIQHHYMKAHVGVVVVVVNDDDDHHHHIY
jgi:hypothetical protein